MKLQTITPAVGIPIVAGLILVAGYASKKSEEKILQKWNETPCRIALDTNYHSAGARSADLSLVIDRIADYDTTYDALITQSSKKTALQNAVAHQDYIDTTWTTNTDFRLSCCVKYQSTHTGPWRKE